MSPLPSPAAWHSCRAHQSILSPGPTPLYKNRSRLHFFVFRRQELQPPFFPPPQVVTPTNYLCPSIHPFGLATTSVDRPCRFPVQVLPSQLTERLPRHRSNGHRVHHRRRPPAVCNQAAQPAKWSRRASPMRLVLPAQPLATDSSRPVGPPSRCGTPLAPGPMSWRWSSPCWARQAAQATSRPARGLIRPIGHGGIWFDFWILFNSIIQFELQKFITICRNIRKIQTKFYRHSCE
jgi:hypothetical protein